MTKSIVCSLRYLRASQHNEMPHFECTRHHKSQIFLQEFSKGREQVFERRAWIYSLQWLVHWQIAQLQNTENYAANDASARDGASDHGAQAYSQGQEAGRSEYWTCGRAARRGIASKMHERRWRW